jgi:NAD(P)H-quinone oxidoreductase subunit 5
MQLLYQYAWLIPIFPLVISLVIGLFTISLRKTAQSLKQILGFSTIGFLFISFILSLCILFNEFKEPSSYKFLLNWIVTPEFSLSIGYYIDPLVSIMLVLVTSVALIVMIYSDSYMSYDEGYIRFFAYLSLFTFSMLGLLLSPNLVQVYIFWELVGMCSYLLIGFWFTRPAAANACQKAFVTNRIGDFSFFLGILGFYWLTGSFEFEEIHKQLYLNTNLANWGTIFSLLVFFGPMAKSAQFPLHVWLPDAMEGPTPISALIHAATMVAAGVFLVARMFPIFHLYPIVMTWIAWIGALTAILAAFIAITQNDVKKSLAYSTISQLGYMIMAMGIGSYSAALFHLLTHAYSKALLFLGSGSIIHGMEEVVGFNPAKNQDMTYMGQLRKYMPLTAFTFLIGTLSLCGIPPLACFWSKDEILAQAFQNNRILWFIGWITAGLTSFYMFRIYFLVFEGTSFRAYDYFVDLDEDTYPHESPFKMTLSLIILACFTIGIGFIGTPFNNLFEHFLEKTPNSNLYLLKELVEEKFDLTFFLLMVGSSVGIAIFGISLSFFFYNKKSLNGLAFIDKFPFLYKLSKNKLYVDEFYEIFFVQPNRKIAQFILYFDQKFLDGLINLSGFFTLLNAENIKILQNGQLQSYLLGIMFSIFYFVFIQYKESF